MRERIAASYLRRYSLAIKRFEEQGKGALSYGAIEERIYQVYSRTPHELKRLYAGRVAIRSQVGLADEFPRAAARAQEYIKDMERIFSSYNVPTQIVHLAFVESMFNPYAVSKVGASGIWQFMPETGKKYLVINDLVDERNSPIKATRAAARFLLDNYKELASWPLAITAYNHGANGIRNAVNRVSSRDIATIIREYSGTAFGFASKNFYSEFLAASNAYRYLEQKGTIPTQRFPQVAAVILKRPTSIQEILTYTSLNARTLSEYNLCLRKKAFSTHRLQKLPASYELFIPKTIATKFVESLNRNLKNQYAVLASART